MKSDIWLWCLVLLGVLAIAVLSPFAQIWAINTLFKTEINYNLTNWFAVIVFNCSWLRIPAINRKKDEK